MGQDCGMNPVHIRRPGGHLRRNRVPTRDNTNSCVAGKKQRQTNKLPVDFPMLERGLGTNCGNYLCT